MQLNKPDLVITGIDKPGMDGITMTREILRRWPEIRVIVLTGIAWDAREAALGAGAKAYLKKPIKFETFLNVVKVLLTS